MTDIGPLIAALRFGDSFFPSGAVVFSWGLETLAYGGRVNSAADIESFALGQLWARWATFDRAAVAAGHAAADLAAVAAVDEQVEIETPIAELRTASRRMGDALLSVFARLGHTEAMDYRGLIKRGEACGHVAPMQGFAWRLAGLDGAAAQALSAHGFVTGLLGAAIRLGCLTHIEAQTILGRAGAEAARIAARAPPDLDEMSCFAMESEIAVMHHARRDLRLFAN